VTTELARAAASLPPMETSTGALLGRRLDRLRTGTPIALAGPRPVDVATPRRDFARPLAEALGGEVVETQDGRLVCVESDHHLPLAHEPLASLPYHIDPRRPLVCLDAETTGLGTAAGTLPFLVGMGVWRGDRFRVRQFVLADHADEAAFLTGLAEAIPADAWLVTYNGRSFDWPLLVARFRLHRRDPPPHAGHLDLLPVARQIWRHRLGDARLATVEHGICGVVRGDDLPGALVPERYFSYLRSRHAGLLRAVVEHNRQDIVSLAQLLVVLATGLGRSERWVAAHPGDLSGLARRYARVGRLDDALGCIEAGLASAAWSRGIVGGAPLHRRLATDRARLLARSGRRAEAAAAWLDIAERGGPGSAAAWLHVARFREHVEHDIPAAIEACRQAAAAVERSRLWGRPLPAVESDLSRRTARLRRRSTMSVNGSSAMAGLYST
jgi:uncharacterized protein YprB with RNaseH-like and TPR domain